MDTISIRGARTHNLKNIDIDLPRDKLIVITGLSGSGKSSLAFDTIYAEGQRRYVESLSAYARQFLSMMEIFIASVPIFLFLLLTLFPFWLILLNCKHSISILHDHSKRFTFLYVF